MRLIGAALVLVGSLMIGERAAWAFCNPGDFCHTAQGPCDQDQFCNSSGVCPTGFLGNQTICRPAAGPCDQDEFCTGNSANCTAPDIRAPVGTVCRAAVGPCDVAETCTGASNACPTDTFAASTVVCRPSAGPCDTQETCTGASATCPGDAFLPSTTVCRPAAAGGCDVAETCTGASAGCPADGFAPSTTVCRASAGPCDVAESCPGNGATCPANGFAPSTKVCRAAVSDCDVAESCPGNAAGCPSDVLQPDNHACSDGDACTVGDACHAGACVAGGPPLVASMVDFGPALVGGTPRSGMLMLQWRDSGSVGVTALTPSTSEFRIAAGQTFPIALSAAVTTANVAMEFQPTAIGPRTATLAATISPATCAVPTIQLVGTGSPPGLVANPVSNDFAQVELGMSSPPKIFQVVNLSGAEATIQSVTISDPTSFSLTADGLPAVTATDGMYSFTIVARPQTAGVHDASVVITSTSAMNPTLTVHVEGVCPGGVCGDGGGGDAGVGGGDGGVGTGGADAGVGGNETPPAAGAVSPLACGAGAPGAGWLVIGLALLFARRRRAQCR